jgi:hypothetical protein
LIVRIQTLVWASDIVDSLRVASNRTSRVENSANWRLSMNKQSYSMFDRYRIQRAVERWEDIDRDCDGWYYDWTRVIWNDDYLGSNEWIVPEACEDDQWDDQTYNRYDATD